MSLSPLMAAISRYHAAEATSATFTEEVFRVASAAFKKAADAVPHHRTSATFINANNERRSLSTEGGATIATARRVLQDVKDGHIFGHEVVESDAEYLAAIRELVIAADKREIEIQSLRVDHRIDAIGAQADLLTRAAAAALDAALTTPVASLGELLAKAEIVQETENWERGGEDLLADIRRLAGGGC